MADRSDDVFEVLYEQVKKMIIEAMNAQGSGTVIFPIKKIPGYLSASWREKIVGRLNMDLREMFGINNVFYRAAHSAKKVEAAIVVEG